MSKYAAVLLLFFITGIIILEPETTQSDFEVYSETSAINQDVLFARHPVYIPKTILKTLITAYSSSPDETDDTPHITAFGTPTRVGVVAANFLPFGTQVRIPEIFGEQVFTVEDRLKPDYNDRVDVWMENKQKAINFGVKITDIEIL